MPGLAGAYYAGSVTTINVVKHCIFFFRFSPSSFFFFVVVVVVVLVVSVEFLCFICNCI